MPNINNWKKFLPYLTKNENYDLVYGYNTVD